MQEYVIVNLDKREFITPKEFGLDPQITEFASAGDGIMFGLATLLADDVKDIYITFWGEESLKFPPDQYVKHGRDKPYRFIHEVFGSWSGDRIVLAGNKSSFGVYVPIVRVKHTTSIAVIEDRNGPDWNLFHWVADTDSGYTDKSTTLVEALLEAKDSWMDPLLANA